MLKLWEYLRSWNTLKPKRLHFGPKRMGHRLSRYLISYKWLQNSVMSTSSPNTRPPLQTALRYLILSPSMHPTCIKHPRKANHQGFSHFPITTHETRCSEILNIDLEQCIDNHWTLACASCQYRFLRKGKWGSRQWAE